MHLKVKMRILLGECTKLTWYIDFDNLLLLFAGNEVVNDIRSAKVSPPYIRVINHHPDPPIPLLRNT